MKYRIVEDDYAGYEVQIKRWWWPFWYQKGYVNTHSTIDEARKYAASGVVEVEVGNTRNLTQKKGK